MQFVSVVIVTNNSEKYIENVLKSVRCQENNNIKIQIVVVDNNSDDNTVELLQNMGITAIKNDKKSNTYDLINKGLSYCEYDYIKIIKNKTVLENNMIEEQLKYIETEGVGAVFCNFEYLGNTDNNDDVICNNNLSCSDNKPKEEWIKRVLFYGNFLCISTILIKKSVLQETLEKSKQYKYIFDTVFVMNLLRKYEITICDENYCTYQSSYYLKSDIINDVDNEWCEFNKSFIDKLRLDEFNKIFDSKLIYKNISSDIEKKCEEIFIFSNCMFSNNKMNYYTCIKNIVKEIISTNKGLNILKSKYFFEDRYLELFNNESKSKEQKFKEYRIIYNELNNSIRINGFREVIIAQPKKYEKLLENKKDKYKIIFFSSVFTLWKLKKFYNLLEEDERFDVSIVVIPISNKDENVVKTHLEYTYNQFKNENYNVIKLGTELENVTYLREEIKPDIIFFNTPFNPPEYRIENYLDTLNCYVPFFFQIASIVGTDIKNTCENMAWKSYQATQFHKNLNQRININKGENVVVTGAPSVDFIKYNERTECDVWKSKDTKLKRIIWGPHQNIDNHIIPATSTFLLYCDTMLDIANKYKDKLQIVFKPHPWLIDRLYKHEDWGKEKADAYYKKWQELENGQFENDDYVELFNSSDALIHCSSTFVAEYLYTNKPALICLFDDDFEFQFNELGIEALNVQYKAKCEQDIYDFIENIVLGEKDVMREDREKFFQQKLAVPNNALVAENMYNDLCSELFK